MSVERLLVLLVVFLVAFVIAVAYFGEGAISRMTAKCQSAGGFIVKGRGEYICVVDGKATFRW